MANLARAYVASGQKSEAVKLLGDLKNRSTPGDPNASEIAVIYAALGETDPAYERLEARVRAQGIEARPEQDARKALRRAEDVHERGGYPPGAPCTSCTESARAIPLPDLYRTGSGKARSGHVRAVQRRPGRYPYPTRTRFVRLFEPLHGLIQVPHCAREENWGPSRSS